MNVIWKTCEFIDSESLVKQPGCFKNSQNPSSIDLLLTNQPCSFCNTCLIETSLSDFYKETLTVFKGKFTKCKPKISTYRDFKNFSNKSFW